MRARERTVAGLELELVEHFDGRDQERERLAGTRLCRTENVLARQQGRNRPRLHLGHLGEAHSFDRFPSTVAEVERRERNRLGLGCRLGARHEGERVRRGVSGSIRSTVLVLLFDLEPCRRARHLLALPLLVLGLAFRCRLLRCRFELGFDQRFDIVVVGLYRRRSSCLFIGRGSSRVSTVALLVRSLALALLGFDRCRRGRARDGCRRCRHGFV